jgi:peptidoglycan/xylan/chitin deacetylase (PgdA/CDA1 family)
MSTDSIRADGVPARRPWRPAAAIKASAVLHAGAVVALAAAPEAWGAVLAAIAANHAVLFGASLAPRSRLLGANLTRLPDAAARRGEIAITFDDGPDPEITPRVLDALDRAGARGTFFCVGSRAQAHPGLVREIVTRGHAVENHSQAHSTAFGWYGPDRLRREIAAAQDTLAALAGRAPAFFRAPFGVRNRSSTRCSRASASPTCRGRAAATTRSTRRARSRAGSRSGSRPATCSCCTTGRDRRARAQPAVLEVLPRLSRSRRAGLKPVTLGAACGDGSGG